jgi:hypothetical protein
LRLLDMIALKMDFDPGEVRIEFRLGGAEQMRVYMFRRSAVEQHPIPLRLDRGQHGNECLIFTETQQDQTFFFTQRIQMTDNLRLIVDHIIRIILHGETPSVN